MVAKNDALVSNLRNLLTSLYLTFQSPDALQKPWFSCRCWGSDWIHRGRQDVRFLFLTWPPEQCSFLCCLSHSWGRWCCLCRPGTPERRHLMKASLSPPLGVAAASTLSDYQSDMRRTNCKVILYYFLLGYQTLYNADPLKQQGY